MIRHVTWLGVPACRRSWTSAETRRRCRETFRKPTLAQWNLPVDWGRAGGERAVRELFYLACAPTVRDGGGSAFSRRGRRKKGEKRRDFETRSLGDGRDAFASRVTRHWHDTSRRVASRLLAFTRSSGEREHGTDDARGTAVMTVRARELSLPRAAPLILDARAARAAPSVGARGEAISRWPSRR